MNGANNLSLITRAAALADDLHFHERQHWRGILGAALASGILGEAGPGLSAWVGMSSDTLPEVAENALLAVLLFAAMGLVRLIPELCSVALLCCAPRRGHEPRCTLSIVDTEDGLDVTCREARARPNAHLYVWQRGSTLLTEINHRYTTRHLMRSPERFQSALSHYSSENTLDLPVSDVEAWRINAGGLSATSSLFAWLYMSFIPALVAACTAYPEGASQQEGGFFPYVRMVLGLIAGYLACVVPPLMLGPEARGGMGRAARRAAAACVYFETRGDGSSPADPLVPSA